MKIALYSIRDCGKGDFGPILCFHTEVDAIRYFKQVINDPSYKFYYKDLDLFEVGEFETNTGGLKGDMSFLVEHGVDVYVGE